MFNNFVPHIRIDIVSNGFKLCITRQPQNDMHNAVTTMVRTMKEDKALESNQEQIKKPYEEFVFLSLAEMIGFLKVELAENFDLPQNLLR